MSTNPFSAQVIQGKFISGRPQFCAPGTRPGVAQPARRGHAVEMPSAFKLSTHGPGKPMPSAVQAKMETAFGTSFADVRIHTGPQAQHLGAHAFTMGSHIYFAPGHYNPNTAQGKRLLGHELAHVVQQRAGRVRNPFGGGAVVVQDPTLEAEAERMAMRAVQPVQATHSIFKKRPSPPETIQRSENNNEPPKRKLRDRKTINPPKQYKIEHDIKLGWKTWAAQNNENYEEDQTPTGLQSIVSELATVLNLTDEGTCAVAILTNGTYVGAKLGGACSNQQMQTALQNSSLPNNTPVAGCTTKAESNLHAEMMIWKEHKAQMVRVAANRGTCPLCARFLEDKGIYYAPIGTMPLFGWINPETRKTAYREEPE